MQITKITRRVFGPVTGAVTLIALILGGCQASTPTGHFDADEQPNVEFSGKLRMDLTPKSRALDTTYISYSEFKDNFYINLIAEDDGYDGYGTYGVATGVQGVLAPKSGSAPLMWQSLYGSHEFYGWTFPQYDGAPAYTYSASPTPMTFYQSSGNLATGGSQTGTDYDVYDNNSFLETFVGAHNGPFFYQDHGKYVELIFKHLVSKMRITKLSLIRTNGSIQNNLNANITLIGIPTEATFYPVPVEGNDASANAPVVVAGDYNQNAGLTLYYQNTATNTGFFYIPPEIDFSQLSFKVEINDLEYGSEGEYYGDFSEVEFVRNTSNSGSSFDSPTGGDSKILHAGEYMTLSLTLYPGQGPGIAIEINDWSTEQPTNATHHPHAGIYSDGEFNDLLGVFSQTMTPEELAEYMQRLMDLYGQTVDNENIFFQYVNVSTTSSSFIVPDGYSYDGTGHQLTMDSTTTPDIFDGDPYVTLQNVSNIYISDGEYTIYIDSEGNIWLMDPATNDFTVKAGAVTPGQSWSINLATGEVAAA